MFFKKELESYFPEIDGLRALAVISVILFHLDFVKFSGGFTGVDVFFVISGFLITRIILRDISRGTFSLKYFYYKRIRRLFPALFTTIIFTFLFAALLFTPEHLERFSRSVLYSIASLSNYFFWKEAGYFDTSSSFKPLLHLWSLATEEQFYLIWPSFLLLLTVFKRKWLVIVGLLFFGIISLIVTELLIKDYPSAVFFLTPFRFIEFSMGALALWINLDKKNHFLLETGFLLGLVLLLYPIYFFSKTTVFPGLNSLVPVIGASMIIIFRSSKIAKFFLANKAATFTGEISYSLYLVHWPLIIFFKYFTGNYVDRKEKIFLIIIMTILSLLLYKYVEQPFRLKSGHKNPIKGKTFFSILSISVLLIVLLANHSRLTHGWTWRYKTIENPFKNVSNFECRNKSSKFNIDSRCTIGATKKAKAEMLFIGDSHAGHFGPALDYLGKKAKLKIDFWFAPDCAPIFFSTPTCKNCAPIVNRRQKTCTKLLREWQNNIQKNKYHFVVLAGRWGYLYGDAQYGKLHVNKRQLDIQSSPYAKEFKNKNRKMLFRALMKKTVDFIHSSQAKVILLSQVPLLQEDIQNCHNFPFYSLLSNSKQTYHCDIWPEYSLIQNRIQTADLFFSKLSSKNTFTFIVSDYFCNKKEKKCSSDFKDYLLYQNISHINREGSIFFAKKIEKEFIKLINSN